MIKYVGYCSIIVSVALAAPDAGSISQDIQKQFSPTSPTILPKISPKEKTSDIADQGIKIVVKGFKLSGNTLITTNELEMAIQSFVGKKLSFNEIQNIARLIAEFYQLKGYSARAFLPPQEVENGIVEIIILEGKLSAIEIDTQATKHLSHSRAQKILETAHPIGETLRLSDIERGLLLLNDTPGIMQSSTLAAGENAGDTKLKIKLQDTSLINGNGSITNTGSKSTGALQESASLSINSPQGIGDQATVQAMTTLGIRYGKLSYSVPVGYKGWRVGVNTSTMRYRVVVGSVQADGTSQSFGISSSYPLVKSSTLSLVVTNTLDKKEYMNRSANVVISDKSNHVMTNSIMMNHFDGIGQTTLSCGWSIGKINLDKIATDITADQAAARTDGYFSKMMFSGSRYQSLNESLSLFLSGTYQKSNKNLDSSEKLYLGGSSGIRAYPNNEAGGDEGWLLNAELTKSLPNSINASVFYDIGRITQHHSLYTNWQGSSQADNSYLIKGYGMSANYSQGTLSLKGTLAWRHGNNPNPQSDGSDNDGTKSTPRAWVQLMKVF